MIHVNYICKAKTNYLSCRMWMCSGLGVKIQQRSRGEVSEAVREKRFSLCGLHPSYTVFVSNRLTSAPATGHTPTRERYAPTRASLPPIPRIVPWSGVRGVEGIFFSRVSKPILDDLCVRVSHPLIRLSGTFRNISAKTIKMTNILDILYISLLYISSYWFYKTRNV